MEEVEEEFVNNDKMEEKVEEEAEEEEDRNHQS